MQEHQNKFKMLAAWILILNTSKLFMSIAFFDLLMIFINHLKHHYMLLNKLKMFTIPENLAVHFANNYDIILASILALGVGLLFSKRSIKGRKGIPGSLGLPFLGETFSLLSATNSTRGCYDFVRLRRSRYGKWFKTRIFGKIHVFIPSPEGAKIVFANDFKLFNKGYVKSMADAVGKKSLLCVPQHSHKRIRRLLSEPFSMNSMSKFVQKIDKLVIQRLNKLEKDGKSFRVLDFNMKMTFDAMCDILMSVTDTCLLEQMEKDCTAVSDAMLSFPVMILGTRYYQGLKARSRLMDTFKNMIAQRRRNGEKNPDDFLQSMLQRDSYSADEKLEDEEIMDNLLTLIIAGQTTTSAAMMWCVKFLNDHKDVQDMLREEQVSILQKKPEGALFTLDDLNKMTYGSKVVKETLRMANVLLWYPRVVLDNCTIAGFEIKKGWHVNVDATHIHYDPEIYKDPMVFNPSRFDEIQKPYCYVPFGSGPRTCLGMNMAKVTMSVFLHRLTAGYKWTVDDPDTSLERKAHIPRLRNGCPITLTDLKN